MRQSRPAVATREPSGWNAMPYSARVCPSCSRVGAGVGAGAEVGVGAEVRVGALGEGQGSGCLEEKTPPLVEISSKGVGGLLHCIITPGGTHRRMAR